LSSNLPPFGGTLADYGLSSTKCLLNEVNPQCRVVDKSSELFSSDLSATVSTVKLPGEWTIICFKCFASLKIKTIEQKKCFDENIEMVIVVSRSYEKALIYSASMH
jgi:hypothetical protein